MYEIFEQLLQSYGITAYKFCKDAGIAQSTISTWKKNGNLISPEIGKTIAEYFNVSVDYLMTGKEREKEDYYLNEETRQIAQEIFDNRDMRVLFDIARETSPSTLRDYADFLQKLKNKDN